MALCYLNLFHYCTKLNKGSSHPLFSPKTSVEGELDSSFTPSHFQLAVHHLRNLEKENPLHAIDSKREQRIQAVLFTLLLDLAQYHDDKCKKGGHHFTVSLEPLMVNEPDRDAYSDIALVSVYDEEQHLILLMEVKLNLHEAKTSIYQAPVKDRNAFGQLLHAAVLSNWCTNRENPILLVLASDKVHHCIKVKIGTDFVTIVEYNIFQAHIGSDDFKKVICRKKC